jgi:hypothetical protein
MGIQENYRNYRYHYALLSYRQAERNERLAVFRSSVQQISPTICGYAEILQVKETESIQSVENVEVAARLQRICRLMQKLSDDLISAISSNDVVVWESLTNSAKQHYLVDDLRSVSQYLQGMTTNLSLNIDTGHLSTTLQDKAMALQANWDVLVNAEEPDIPVDIVSAHQFHKRMQEEPVGDPQGLPVLLEAAAYSLAVIRHDAAVLLRHYHDERAVTALINLLADEVEEIVAWSANSLGYLQSRDAVPALIASLNREFDNQAYVGWIAEAISAIPDEAALDPLIALLDRYMNDTIRIWQIDLLPIAGLCKAIAAIGGDKAHAVLTKYFNDSEL